VIIVLIIYEHSDNQLSLMLSLFTYF